MIRFLCDFADSLKNPLLCHVVCAYVDVFMRLSCLYNSFNSAATAARITKVGKYRLGPMTFYVVFLIDPPTSTKHLIIKRRKNLHIFWTGWIFVLCQSNERKVSFFLRND